MASDIPKSLLHLWVLYTCQLFAFSCIHRNSLRQPSFQHAFFRRMCRWKEHDIFRRPTSLHAGLLQTKSMHSSSELFVIRLGKKAKHQNKTKKTEEKNDCEWKCWLWSACKVATVHPSRILRWPEGTPTYLERQVWDKWNLDTSLDYDSNKNTCWYKTFKNCKRKDCFLQDEESLLFPVWEEFYIKYIIS